MLINIRRIEIFLKHLQNRKWPCRFNTTYLFYRGMVSVMVTPEMLKILLNQRAIKSLNQTSIAPLASNTIAKTKSISFCWKLYYQAKFKIFLLKNKITLSDSQAKVIIINNGQPDMNTKWIKAKNSDNYKDIDFNDIIN